LALVRSALILTWSGSLLYIGLGEGVFVLAAALSGRRDLLGGQALSVLASAALVAPWVAAAGPPLGGGLTSTTLSWLHVLALLGVAALCATLLALEGLRPSQGFAERCARIALLGGLGLAALLAFPDLREALLPGAGFLAKSDDWATFNPEQRALFSSSLVGWRSPAQLYGAFAYLIPLVPLAPLLRIRRRAPREPMLMLALWSLALGILAVSQVRFGNDFAPVASVGFALLLAELPRRAAAWRPSWRRPSLAATALLAPVLLWPALASLHFERLPGRIAHLRRPKLESPLPADQPLTPKQSLLRFAEIIREVTPETAGYFEPSLQPEYSILCRPTFGHVMHFAARRATPANNMGPHLNAEKFALVERFFLSRSEPEALSIAERLGARFVLTAASAGLHPPRLEHQLHRQDGSADGDREHLERFRLVAEGPVGGKPLHLMYPRGSPRRVVAYKLFEIVEGAVFVARIAPGQELDAELRIETPLGRSFRYIARTNAGADGIARLRVPYPTTSRGRIRSGVLYRLRVGDETISKTVSELDVKTGREISLNFGSAQAANDPLPRKEPGPSLPDSNE
ncbi:MAG: hypothetical protein V3T33_09215, partial [Myxococcota bacterium]